MSTAGLPVAARWLLQWREVTVAEEELWETRSGDTLNATKLIFYNYCLNTWTLFASASSLYAKQVLSRSGRELRFLLSAWDLIHQQAET